MTENFPNLGGENEHLNSRKSIDSNQDEPKEPKLRHVIIKLSKSKTKRES